MDSSRNERWFRFWVSAIVVYFAACLILTYTVAEPYPAIMAPEFRLPKEAGLPERTVSVVEVHRVDQVGGRSIRRPLHTDSLFPEVPPHLQAALFAASGVIAQHLVPPEWTEHGAANLLNKPKGPHYWSDNRGPFMTVGLASGYGSPNYILVRQFKDFVTKKELNPVAEELLAAPQDGRHVELVVHDQAFHLSLLE